MNALTSTFGTCSTDERLREDHWHRAERKEAVSGQNLGDETTTLIADGDELFMERIFDVPRELVWAALTSPEHIPHWWGPRGSTATVVEMDVRPAGRWRGISRTCDAGGAPFPRAYLASLPPHPLPPPPVLH